MLNLLIQHFFLFADSFLMKFIGFLFHYPFEFCSKIYKFVRFCNWQKCEFS
jgi:hypothetical protein